MQSPGAGEHGGGQEVDPPPHPPAALHVLQEQLQWLRFILLHVSFSFFPLHRRVVDNPPHVFKRKE